MKNMSLEKYEKLVEHYPDSFRFSMSNTANNVAYKGMQNADKQVRKDFIIRNKYVLGGKLGRGALRYDKAKPHHDLNKIESRWGSIKSQGSKDYKFMERQEGGFNSKKSSPVEGARTSGTKQKRIKRGAYRQQIIKLKGNDYGSTVAAIQQLWASGQAMPGSKQLFHLKPGLYHNYDEGLFQFSRKNITPGRSKKTNRKLKFANFRRLFYYGSSSKKRRRAQYWMKVSNTKITQQVINDYFLKNMDKALDSIEK